MNYNFKRRSKELTVRYEAMKLAYHENASFTVEAFATRQQFVVNRHLRRVLNQMAREGLLAKHKTLYDDGHYRMVYAAEKTARLNGL